MSPRWIILALMPACGGAPFVFDPGEAPDADPMKAGQTESSAPADAGVDALKTLKPDAAPPEASTPEAAPPDAGAPEASGDACAAPAWDCRGHTIGVHAICATYRNQDGGVAGVVLAEAPACPWCGASCACIGAGPCGSFGADPPSHLAGCVDHGPNQVEVICQE